MQAKEIGKIPIFLSKISVYTSQSLIPLKFLEFATELK